MLDEEPDSTWAAELLDLEIVASACYLEAQLGYVRRGEPPPVYPVDVPKVGAHWHVLDLERLLSFKQVEPRPLHATIREIIDAYRSDPMAVSLGFVDRLDHQSAEELRRDLHAAPATEAEYQDRIGALVRRVWLGEHARSIPRGWLPIFERAVTVGEAAICEPKLAISRTSILTERFSRLEWIVAPRNRKMGTLHQYGSFASRQACMACGGSGEVGRPTRDARSLLLCSEHRDLRHTDPQAFWQASFPGTAPEVPKMKL